MYFAPGGSESLMAPPKTYVNSRTNITGWMNEKTSSCGTRKMWIRFRFVTVTASVSVHLSFCDGATATTAMSLSLLFRAVPREDDEHVIERRTPHDDVRDLHVRLVELPHRFRDDG